DNRPLRFEEFDSVIGQRLYVSATPADYELERSGGLIVEQVVRPTGLLDPPVEVRKTEGQIDDLIEEIRERASKDQRVLVTTLTKRMAEELDKFLQKIHIRCTYIHSDVETLERIRILEEFQKGYYDVLIGVNLLREGLDLPQVSLVAILDADKEGFLRSERSLTQTAGRAARNVDGKVIMYADRITDSMARTIRETERRRNKQIQYNRENGITPTQIAVNVRDTLRQGNIYREQRDSMSLVAEDPVTRSMTPQQLEKAIATARQRMEDAASKLDFITAAGFRDEMYALEKLRK
ncbi:MAG: helicase-related protein, partial [Bacteroidales bacterium]|nr:helicase-related protein [Bacteroidales bacterium]